jgi:hypothetical protein
LNSSATSCMQQTQIGFVIIALCKLVHCCDY